MNREIIYKSRNSPFDILVTDMNGTTIYTAAQMDAITRVILKYTPSTGADPEYADSDESGHEDMFDWETYEAQGRLVIDPGLLNFTAGYDSSAKVIVYDPDYPSGRVVTKIRLTVSDAALDDGALVSPIYATSYIDITDDYQMLASDWNGGIRMDATTDKTITAVAATASDDTKTVHLLNLGTGDLIFSAPVGYFAGSTSHTKLTGKSVLASATLMYIHAIRTWVVIDSKGSWEGGN